MADIFYTLDGVELKEGGGEGFTTVVKSGQLVVTGSGAAASLSIDGNALPFVPSARDGPFKKLDSRSYQFATTDLMTWMYLTVPKGLPEATYTYVDDLLSAMRDAKPLPTPPAAAAAPAAAPAAAAAGAPEVAPKGTGAAAVAAPAGAAAGAAGLGAMLKNMADKAAHDTMMMAQAIKEKAMHDTQLLQQQMAESKAAKEAAAAAAKPATP